MQRRPQNSGGWAQTQVLELGLKGRGGRSSFLEEGCGGGVLMRRHEKVCPISDKIFGRDKGERAVEQEPEGGCKSLLGEETLNGFNQGSDVRRFMNTHMCI